VDVCLFSTESGCRYGASCRFIHGTVDTAAAGQLGDDGKDGVDTRLGKVMGEAAAAAEVGGMAAAMASLSVDDQRSLPVTAANDSSTSAGASTCPSTSTLHSASTAAAAVGGAGAKLSRKKKRTAKKGARKTKESKSKELVLYDHQTVKCGMLVLQSRIA